MIDLSIQTAVDFLRKSLDELESAEAVGLMVSHDDLDLQKLVEASIVEAVIATHMAADATMIEGKKGTEGTDYSQEADGDVVTLKMLSETLRIVSLKASDSPIRITEFFPETSPEGRMQLNPAIRGRYDSPKAIIQKLWDEDKQPSIKYYTLSGMEQDVTFDVEFIPYPELTDNKVSISARMQYPVLNMLVAIVLQSLGEFEKAEQYKKKSQEYTI